MTLFSAKAFPIGCHFNLVNGLKFEVTCSYHGLLTESRIHIHHRSTQLWMYGTCVNLYVTAISYLIC